jgi:hypothetical protein
MSNRRDRLHSRTALDGSHTGRAKFGHEVENKVISERIIRVYSLKL